MQQAKLLELGYNTKGNDRIPSIRMQLTQKGHLGLSEVYIQCCSCLLKDKIDTVANTILPSIKACTYIEELCLERESISLR